MNYKEKNNKYLCDLKPLTSPVCNSPLNVLMKIRNLFIGYGVSTVLYTCNSNKNKIHDFRIKFNIN